jgi:hypothetical protein
MYKLWLVPEVLGQQTLMVAGLLDKMVYLPPSLPHLVQQLLLQAAAAADNFLIQGAELRGDRVAELVDLHISI